MRVIAVGCEYTGVSALLDGLFAWGAERGMRFHRDDHFSIPDRYHLDPEDQRTMASLSPVLKERFQRMQIVYHIRVMQRHEHCLLGGFHIEEAVYGPRYYYPGREAAETRNYEFELPDDAILIHLKAREAVIRARLESTRHDFNLIAADDIPTLLEAFQTQYAASNIRRKFEIDTSDLTPDQLLQTCLSEARPYLNTRDMLRLLDERLATST